MAKKQIKVGVRRGGGSAPGYQWDVDILDLAYHEACDFLDGDQYRHVAEQFQVLAMQGDPTHSQEISLDAVEGFFELRDWGGILYPRNVRVFFGVDDARRAIVVLVQLTSGTTVRLPWATSYEYDGDGRST